MKRRDVLIAGGAAVFAVSSTAWVLNQQAEAETISYVEYESARVVRIAFAPTSKRLELSRYVDKTPDARIISTGEISVEDIQNIWLFDDEKQRAVMKVLVEEKGHLEVIAGLMRDLGETQ